MFWKTPIIQRLSPLLKNPLFLLWLIATAVFVVQHAVTFSWDFSAFVSNARFWFHQGNYFEQFRPPLMPFILGLLGFIGSFPFAEYVYIVLMSGFYLYSSLRLARALRIDRVLFYLFLINPFVLWWGLFNGSELLATSLLMLFFACLLERRLAGHYLGFSILARFTSLQFLPLLIFDIGSWLRFLFWNPFLVVLPLLPWLVYNYFSWGNMFATIADGYANNVKYRDYIHSDPSLFHFGIILNILIPFLLTGLWVFFSSIIRQTTRKKNSAVNGLSLIQTLKKIYALHRHGLFMFVVFAIIVRSYFFIPTKEPRLSFYLVVPAAYFAVLGVMYLSQLVRLNFQRVLVWGMVILYIFALFYVLVFVSFSYDKPSDYDTSVTTLRSLHYDDCAIKSNRWSMLNYLGIASTPYAPEDLISSYIHRGYLLVYFSRAEEPLYAQNTSFLKTFPIAHQDSEMIVLGKQDHCLHSGPVHYSYMNTLQETIHLRSGYSLNTNYCLVLFEDNPLFEKWCNFVNYGRFEIDLNRTTR